MCSLNARKKVTIPDWKSGKSGGERFQCVQAERERIDCTRFRAPSATQPSLTPALARLPLSPEARAGSDGRL